MTTSPTALEHRMSRHRAAVAAAALTTTTLGALVAAAAPSAAGSTDRADYAFTFASTAAASGEGITAHVTSDAADASPMGLHDYTDPTSADVVYAAPAPTETLSVGVRRAGRPEVQTLSCRTGRTHYYSGLFVGGNAGDWANLADGATTTVRVRLNCTTADETVHHLHWGEHRLSSTKWMSPAPTPDCVTLTRNGDVFTVTAKGCVVQDEIVAWKPSKQLSTSNVAADFTATISRGALLHR